MGKIGLIQRKIGRKGGSLVIWIIMISTFILTNLGVEVSLAQQKVIKLKFAEQLSTTHYFSREGGQFWMKRAKELTNDQLQFQYFPSEQLVKGIDMLDALGSRIVDAGYIVTAYFASRMPLISGACLLANFENNERGTEAIWAVVNSKVVLENDFTKNGIRPILLFSNPAFQIWTTKKQVKKVADIKGMKIGSTGGVQDLIIKSWGAVPVQIPMPDVYEALQRGTLDGKLISAASVHAYKLEEICKYETGVDVDGGALGYVINENVWQSLPDDIKTAMKRTSDEAVERLGKILDREAKQWKSEFIKKGISMYEPTSEELREWNDLRKPVVDSWVKKMSDQGLPGRQVLDELRTKAKKSVN